MNPNKTYQVFYVWKRRGKNVTGMSEVEAESPTAAIAAVRAEKPIQVTDLIVRKRGYWEQVLLTPEILGQTGI